MVMVVMAYVVVTRMLIFVGGDGVHWWCGVGHGVCMYVVKWL